MKPDILRQSPVATATITLLLLTLFWSRYFMFSFPEHLPTGNTMPFEGLLLRFQTGYPLPSIILSAFIAVASGFLLVRLTIRNLVSPVRTYLPFVLYVTAACGVYIGERSPAILAASLLLIAGTDYLASSFTRTASFGNVFRGSFLMGFIPLFHAPAIVYILMVPVAMRLFRRNGRETIVALSAAVMPLAACAYILWATGEPFARLFRTLYDIIISPAGNSLYDLSVSGWLRSGFLAVMASLFLISTAAFLLMTRDMRTKALKINWYSVVLTVVGLCVLMLPCRSVEQTAFLAIPFTILSTSFFVRFGGKMSVIFYALTILSSIALNIYPFLF